MVIDFIIVFLVGAIGYAFGYTQHNQHIREDYLRLREDYDLLYMLDTTTIEQLVKKVDDLEKELATKNRGSDD